LNIFRDRISGQTVTYYLFVTRLFMVLVHRMDIKLKLLIQKWLKLIRSV